MTERSPKQYDAQAMIDAYAAESGGCGAGQPADVPHYEPTTKEWKAAYAAAPGCTTLSKYINKPENSKPSEEAEQAAKDHIIEVIGQQVMANLETEIEVASIQEAFELEVTNGLDEEITAILENNPEADEQ